MPHKSAHIASRYRFDHSKIPLAIAMVPSLLAYRTRGVSDFRMVEALGLRRQCERYTP